MDYRQPFSGSYPITQKFGEVIEGVTYKGLPHTGIDYACPSGTSILASADGIVKVAKNDPNGYGKYIILEHPDGNATLYAHLWYYNNLFEGKQVKQGDLIAYSDNSGNSTGPHLHFEMRNGGIYGTPFDPLLKLRSVWEEEPVKTSVADAGLIPPEYSGDVKVICDLANARCHCDMTRIVKTVSKGTVLTILPGITAYNGLQYREFTDPETKCLLRIAEFDGFGTQILEKSD